MKPGRIVEGLWGLREGLLSLRKTLRSLREALRSLREALRVAGIAIPSTPTIVIPARLWMIAVIVPPLVRMLRASSVLVGWLSLGVIESATAIIVPVLVA